jgi:lipoate-protein ligase B
LVAELLDAAAATARDRGCICQIDCSDDVGVWSQGAKLASIGLSHQHGVAGHGLALNAAIDTRLSSGLTLCGHRDARTASVCPPDCERPPQLSEFAAQLFLQLLTRQTP